MVRHPLDRFASHYSYIRKRGSLAHIKSLDDYASARVRQFVETYYAIDFEKLGY